LKNIITSALGVREGNGGEKYLGFPIVVARSKIVIFNFIKIGFGRNYFMEW